MSDAGEKEEIVGLGGLERSYDEDVYNIYTNKMKDSMGWEE